MIYDGRIIKGISGFYYVCDEHSRIFECKAKGSFRNDHIKPLVGDYVNFEIVDNKKMIGNITEISARNNELIRPSVANIDKALLVFAIKNPNPSFHLLDKLIIYYMKQNIDLVICFNKSDLASDEEIERIKNIYKGSNINIIFSSFTNDNDISDIKELLKGHTTVISGPSGVGKSTLINLLVPEADMSTGEISQKLKRGKHTTRHSEIFPLDNNTFILDTPGFTSFDLTDIPAEEIKKYYPEFSIYDKDCKYLDCIHVGEIDCGVKNALICGKINEERYNNYKLIIDEIKRSNRR